MATYARFIEPVNLQVRTYPCRLPNLQPGARPIRLVHLSDLHASISVPNSLIESALGAALELKPDLLCITGDFVTVRTGWDPSWYRRTLRRISAQVPVYASMGNHDGGWRGSRMDDSSYVRSVLRDSGLEILHNRSTVVTAAGQQIELVGLGDLWGHEFIPGQAFGHTAAKPHPRIVLSHNPDTKDHLTHKDWDLMLSGHTHGGQIVIPMVGSPWAPVKDKRYLHGLAPWGSRQIHVTCGVGSAGGVRLNCPPELVVLELAAA